MAKVVQCDSCKGIITERRQIIHVNLRVTMEETLLAQEDDVDLCSGACLITLIEAAKAQAVKSVSRQHYGRDKPVGTVGS